jgi:hypothetical protein
VRRLSASRGVSLGHGLPVPRMPARKGTRRASGRQGTIERRVKLVIANDRESVGPIEDRRAKFEEKADPSLRLSTIGRLGMTLLEDDKRQPAQ